MLLKLKTRFLTVLLFLSFSFLAHAQLQIHSVTTTPITCPNNGTITVSASTANPPLLYSITGGPALQPAQTNPVFSSMLPGTYQVRVADGAGNQQTVSATVAGTYNNPEFNYTTEKPYCSGQSTGSITGLPVPGAGTAPFTWQVIAPVAAAPQASPVLSNLSAGNYTVRLTDACGGFKTTVVTIQDPNTANPFYGGPVANKIGCDSMNLTFKLNTYDFRPPLTYKYETSSGSVFTYNTEDQLLTWPGYAFIQQAIPAGDYGETITITVYNACGDSTSATIDLNTFEFYPSFGYQQCGNKATIFLTNDPIQIYDTGMMPPVSFTVTDVASGTVVDQGSVGVPPTSDIINTHINWVTSAPLDVNRTYTVQITDGCGETFTQDYFIPGQAPVQVIGKDIIQGACIDSVVGSYRVHATGFHNGQLIITSGPAGLGSTSPGFEYTDTYSFPDTIPDGGGYWYMQNLGPGTYHFKIIDSCGNELHDSIVVTPQDVTHLSYDLDWKRGCLGQNKIFYSLVPEGTVTVTDLSTGGIIHTSPFYTYGTSHTDSVLNVPSGTYQVTFEFQQVVFGTMLNDQVHNCWTKTEIITIDAYQTPDISVGNAILCNNDIHFALIPDSTKGVPAYQYEIISGPQTFPVQSSNVFTISQPGTYVARIYDVCGNASTKQITADTLSFEPISVASDCYSSGLAFPPSVYYTYEWLMPSGQVHTGNSLNLQPVTPADTGVYVISKIVSIDGCSDTLQTTYHVAMPNYLDQTIPFCQGSTVTVGGNTYTAPGIYHDTLTSLSGCDSIVVTHLTILPQSSDTTDMVICPGDSLLIGGQYRDLPGLYIDSVQNAGGCYDLHLTNLMLYHSADTTHISICSGSSYSFGGVAYGSSGYYVDTLVSSAGCDSIRVLHLAVLPYIHYTSYVTVCHGYSYTFGTHVLSQTGIYSDTLQTAGCDSIVTLHLTVAAAKVAQVVRTICQGEQFSVGSHIYTMPGTYTDTIFMATCDSIVNLTLIVLPLKYDTIHRTICEGDNFPFGGTHYTHSGVYTHAFPTSGCDSIVTLDLTVVPSPSVNIVTHAYETGNGVFVQLDAISATSPLSYAWTSSAVLSGYTIPNPTTTILHPTWVYVTVTDANGCASTAGYEVQIPATSTLYIPNAFTPQGDEANQVFRFYGTNIAQFELIIFDRWGEVIYETTDVNGFWDGTYRDRIVQDGTYVYKVFAIGLDDVTYDLSGHVTVLR